MYFEFLDEIMFFKWSILIDQFLKSYNISGVKYQKIFQATKKRNVLHSKVYVNIAKHFKFGNFNDWIKNIVRNTMPKKTEKP